MPLPLVSVVIPIFNQAKFVVETVGSAVRQTYRNLQVIVVDDGSTDNGPELLEAEFGEHIVLLRQKNAGPSAAINTGLAAATGSFIALLGGDDLCVEDRIDVQLEIMRTTPHDIVFSKPFLIDEGGKPMDDASFPVFFNSSPIPSMLRALVLQGNFLCAPTAFMRREAVQSLGVFRPGLVQLQDYDYWLRAAAAGMSLAELGPRVVRYRRHSGNLSLQGGSVASAAETVPVIKTVLETGMPEELRRAFPYFFEPVADSSVPLTSFDKASLLLSHPRDELRMAGLEYAIALAEDPSFIAKASRLGLNHTRLAHKSL